ncbi:MAG: 2OG-Fe(II) oxygenase family protein [Pseudomonadales bacterium]|nr:2OG-Fe(II) oxygenase family protein [Pseudomonadales bacterium]
MNPAEFSKHILPVFVTPVVNYRWPDSDSLNAKLRELILKMETTEPSVNKSNVGGWHSSLDFLAREADAIQALRERLWEFSHHLLQQFSRQNEPGMQRSALRIEGWANILRYGQYHSVHTHPNAAWSGVYYVTGNQEIEDNPFSGRFELLDPRPGASVNYADSSNLYSRFLLNPSPGQMLVFPAWMQHQVHPYFGDSERITIAFNLMI